MRKSRIYLDTSVLSTIDAPHLSNKEAITIEFFRILEEKPDDYEVIVSPVLLDEVNNAPEAIRKRSLAILQSVQASEVPRRREAEVLAQLYVEAKALSDKHFNDLRHVAYAVTERCDYIVSWNMRHLARVWTIDRVNAVNLEYRYPMIQIVTPEVFTGELPNA
ncbi:MAG: PIN domain-containing protein [Planctomycetaceae bacterium]|nr:PIN domain-containing protein [Planctomycetaceae bacterium]